MSPVASLESFRGTFERFRASSVIAARHVFQALDPKLKPEVFLACAAEGAASEHRRIVWLPEDSNLDALGRPPGSGESVAGWLDAKSRTGPFTYFNSAGVPWEGGLGWVVLRFPRAGDIPTLEDVESGSRSLLEALAREFLAIVVHALGAPEPGRELSLLIREPEDILRAAGKAFLSARVPCELSTSSRPTRLFASLDVISSLRYEGTISRGRMILSRLDHPAVDVGLRFSSPIPLRNYRAIRKLLELATEDLFLLSDGSFAYGLGSQVAPVSPAAADLLGVDFVDRFTWKLRLDQKDLMLVTHGQPALPRQRVREEEFRRAVLDLFPGTSPKSAERLWALARAAIDETRGTLLVVSAGAGEEAERLESQGTRILPSGLTPEMLRRVSSIDGAVLLDPNAVCHAIGVILDGRAGRGGDPSRGARYNSAVRYQASSPYPCLALVVSEDGAVDLLGARG